MIATLDDQVTVEQAGSCTAPLAEKVVVKR